MHRRRFRISIILPVFLLGVLAGAGGSHFLTPIRTSEHPNSLTNPKGDDSEKTPRGAITLAESSTPTAAVPHGPTSSMSGAPEALEWKGLNDSDDTVGAIRISVKNQSTEGKLEYLELLRQLTPDEAPQMLAMFRELSQQGYAVREYDRLFWERWAEIDGEAACDLMFERDKRFKETGLSKLAISAWARNDPDAASTWLFSQEDIPLREGMIKGLLEGMAIRDPASAQQFLTNTNLTNEQLAHGYSEIARQFHIQKGLGSVGEWYGSFSESDPAYAMVTNATAQIFSRASFADALSWAESLDGSSAVRQQLHARLAHNRPDGLLTYLGYTPDAGALTGVESLTRQAVSRWTQTNPNAMGKWLDSNSDIPNYDLVAVPFVEQIAREDLDAAQAWAETLHDEEIRLAVKIRIGRE